MLVVLNLKLSAKERAIRADEFVHWCIDGLFICVDSFLLHFPLLMTIVLFQECSAMNELIQRMKSTETALTDARAKQVIDLIQKLKVTHTALVVGDDDCKMMVRTEPLGTSQWEEFSPCPQKSTGYSACASPDGIIISGGCIDNENHAISTCYMYDVGKGHWVQLPSMQKARYWHGSIYHDGGLYVVGGLNDPSYLQTSYLDSVERLDMQSHQWTALPSLPQALGLPLVVSVSGKLYALGGGNASWKESLDVYEYTGRAWQPKSKMPFGSLGCAAVEFNGCIFVVGGDERRCMRYDPRTDQWSHMKQPQFKHWRGAGALYHKNILLLGGEENDQIEQFDPQADSWSQWQVRMPWKNDMRFAFFINNYKKE